MKILGKDYFLVAPLVRSPWFVLHRDVVRLGGATIFLYFIE
jgi:hypothetical protein